MGANIIYKALENLATNTGVKAVWKQDYRKENDGEIDFIIDNENLHFIIEIKKELRQHQVPNIIDMANGKDTFMVVAQNIFP